MFNIDLNSSIQEVPDSLEWPLWFDPVNSPKPKFIKQSKTKKSIELDKIFSRILKKGFVFTNLFCQPYLTIGKHIFRSEHIVSKKMKMLDNYIFSTSIKIFKQTITSIIDEYYNSHNSALEFQFTNQESVTR